MYSVSRISGLAVAILFLSAGFCLTHLGRGASGIPSGWDGFRMFDLHVQSRMALNYDCSAGAALILYNGELIHEKYFGTTHKGEGGETVHAETRFPYYSVSKEFGIALLFSMITEGMLDLDDPVAKYIPSFKDAGPDGAPWLRETVTLRHLAGHIGGVRRPGNDLPPYNDVCLEFEPGQGFRYNELGMRMLGTVMEVVAEKPYDILLQERILKPLGLESVGFLYEGEPLDGVVHVYNGPVKSYHSYTDKPYPGSLLYGNMRDILMLGQLWLNKGKWNDQIIFRSDLADQAWEDHIFRGRPRHDYHYGLMFWLSPEVKAVFMAGGAKTQAAILPEHNMVILMGLNQYGNSPGWGKPPDEHMATARMGHAIAERIRLEFPSSR